jgi:intracellular septation protein A
MNKTDLLKKMLPGFLPIIIFVIADEIWGTIVGLIVAIVVGIIELIISYFKNKKIDTFILLDTALLIGMGLVSIILDNDIFFKLKPALINVIFCALLGISAFSEKNIIMLMSKRYMKDMQINRKQEEKMKASIQVLFWIFTLHTILIVISAYFMSKAAWAFISGGLLYIIFGMYFLIELIRNKLLRKSSSDITSAEIDNYFKRKIK